MLHSISRLCFPRAILFGAVLLFWSAGSIAQIAHAATSFTTFVRGEPNPVLSGGGSGSWDEVVREKVQVIKDGGIYKMWYVGHRAGQQATSKVGYATSPDGIQWTKYTGNPIISRSTQDQDISVVKLSNGTYYMYVEVNDSYLDLFTSTNGINWTPYAENPIKTDAASPVVWQEGTTWYLLYESMVLQPNFNIHLATSTDGKVWVDNPANPVLSEDNHTVPDSIIKNSGVYHLYYHREEPGNGWPGWYATSTNLTTWTNRRKLMNGFGSQYVYQTQQGQLWAYIWYELGDSNYYLRYGEDVAFIYPLDEGSGTLAVEASGSGVNGTLINGTTWVPGVFGQALSFNGVDNYVETGYGIDLPTWTVSAWVRSPAAPSSAAASGPVHREKNFQINWNHPDSSFRGAAALQVDGVWYAAKFGTLLANTWYHLAATYDGENLKAYRNGALITDNAAPSGFPDTESETLNFGRHAGVGQYFQGTVDDIRIYSKALTAAEIAALATSTDTTAPSSVTLTASAGGQSVSLSWAAASDFESGIASYRLYRGTTSGSKSLLAQMSGTVLAYTDTATAPGATYFYEVSALNGAGLEGPRSNETAVTIFDASPSAPTGLSAVAGDGQVVLNWIANTEADLAGYDVYRGTTTGGPYAKINSALVTAIAYTDTGLTNGVTYYYVIRAVDLGGNNSVQSNQASAIPGSASVPGLIGYWKLDEGIGLVATDASGNGLHGTLINGTTWATGYFGQALSFDGANDYVETDYRTDLPTWTVSTWVRSPAAPSSGAASGPVHREKNFQINWDHPNSVFRGAAGVQVRGVWYAASFGTLLANTWYHLAATYDGENLKAYRNGVLITDNAAPSGPPDSEPESLNFGRHAGAPQYFSGMTDNVRLYNRALTAAEIATLATSP